MPDKQTKVVEPAPVTKAEPTFKELTTMMVVAGQAGNDTEVIRLSKLILKQKSDVEKAAALQLQAEATAMAGDREALSAQIMKAVSEVVNTADLLKVKAKGFTFTIDHTENDKGQIDPAGTVKVTGGCALIVPAIRKTGGGGGGSTGQLKSQTGLSRHELIDQFATNEEKVAIQTAESEATSRPDSARYSAEKPVIKRILGDNPQLIKR